jgi:hypothetical protein
VARVNDPVACGGYVHYLQTAGANSFVFIGSSPAKDITAGGKVIDSDTTPIDSEDISIDEDSSQV